MIKTNWTEVRKRTDAWKHIASSIDGEVDTLTCRVCGDQWVMVEDDRSRESVYREMARKHYYKHKLWETLPEIAAPTSEEVPLFAEV